MIGPLETLKPGPMCLIGTMPKPQGVHPNTIGYIMSDWNRINTETFTGHLETAYNEFVSAQETMRTKRSRLEEIMVKRLAKECPRGQHAIFGYRWGMVSYAFVDKTTTKAKATGGVTI